MGFVNWKKDKKKDEPVKQPVNNTGGSEKNGFEKVFAMMTKFMPASQRKIFWGSMKADKITLLMEPDVNDSKFLVSIRKQNENGEFEVLHKFIL